MKKTFTNSPERLAELEAKAKEVINLVCNYFADKNIHGVNVVRIGHWVYVDGEVIRQSDSLRAALKSGEISSLKFRYSPTRKAFAWAPYTWRGKSSKASTEQLADKYGYEGVKV
jgi:hypothetical protein